VFLFGLSLPRRAEKSKHLPRSSISIALSTARTPMPPDQRAGWARTSVRVASACSSLKTMRGSSALRSRWKFRLRCGSPTSGRSETCSSCRHTDGSELVAPSSLPSERLQSRRRTAAGLADWAWQRPRPSSLRRQRLRHDQGLLVTHAAAALNYWAAITPGPGSR